MSTTLRVFGGLSKSTLHIPAQDKKNKGEFLRCFFRYIAANILGSFLSRKNFIWEGEETAQPGVEFLFCLMILLTLEYTKASIRWSICNNLTLRNGNLLGDSLIRVSSPPQISSNLHKCYFHPQNSWNLIRKVYILKKSHQISSKTF